MQRGECTCVGNLEKMELVDQYAEHIAEEIGDTMGGTCGPMMNFFVERLVARIMHMQAMSNDETISYEITDKLLTAVRDGLFRLSGTAPAALKVIIDEARAREGDANARH
jgi:hypothetical protein